MLYFPGTTPSSGRLKWDACTESVVFKPFFPFSSAIGEILSELKGRLSFSLGQWIYERKYNWCFDRDTFETDAMKHCFAFCRSTAARWVRHYVDWHPSFRALKYGECEEHCFEGVYARMESERLIRDFIEREQGSRWLSFSSWFTKLSWHFNRENAAYITDLCVNRLGQACVFVRDAGFNVWYYSKLCYGTCRSGTAALSDVVCNSLEICSSGGSCLRTGGNILYRNIFRPWEFASQVGQTSANLWSLLMRRQWSTLGNDLLELFCFCTEKVGLFVARYWASAVLLAMLGHFILHVTKRRAPKEIDFSHTHFSGDDVQPFCYECFPEPIKESGHIVVGGRVNRVRKVMAPVRCARCDPLHLKHGYRALTVYAEAEVAATAETYSALTLGPKVRETHTAQTQFIAAVKTKGWQLGWYSLNHGLISHLVNEPYVPDHKWTWRRGFIKYLCDFTIARLWERSLTMEAEFCEHTSSYCFASPWAPLPANFVVPDSSNEVATVATEEDSANSAVEKALIRMRKHWLYISENAGRLPQLVTLGSPHVWAERLGAKIPRCWTGPWWARLQGQTADLSGVQNSQPCYPEGVEILQEGQQPFVGVANEMAESNCILGLTNSSDAVASGPVTAQQCIHSTKNPEGLSQALEVRAVPFKHDDAPKLEQDQDQVQNPLPSTMAGRHIDHWVFEPDYGGGDGVKDGRRTFQSGRPVCNRLVTMQNMNIDHNLHEDLLEESSQELFGDYTDLREMHVTKFSEAEEAACLDEMSGWMLDPESVGRNFPKREANTKQEGCCTAPTPLSDPKWKNHRLIYNNGKELQMCGYATCAIYQDRMYGAKRGLFHKWSIKEKPRDLAVSDFCESLMKGKSNCVFEIDQSGAEKGQRCGKRTFGQMSHIYRGLAKISKKTIKYCCPNLMKMYGIKLQYDLNHGLHFILRPRDRYQQTCIIKFPDVYLDSGWNLTSCANFTNELFGVMACCFKNPEHIFAKDKVTNKFHFHEGTHAEVFNTVDLYHTDSDGVERFGSVKSEFRPKIEGDDGAGALHKAFADQRNIDAFNERQIHIQNKAKLKCILTGRVEFIGIHLGVENGKPVIPDPIRCWTPKIGDCLAKVGSKVGKCDLPEQMARNASLCTMFAGRIGCLADIFYRNALRLAKAHPEILDKQFEVVAYDESHRAGLSTGFHSCRGVFERAKECNLKCSLNSFEEEKQLFNVSLFPDDIFGENFTATDLGDVAVYAEVVENFENLDDPLEHEAAYLTLPACLRG